MTPHAEGEPYLREFRTVRHFPGLREVSRRTADDQWSQAAQPFQKGHATGSRYISSLAGSRSPDNMSVGSEITTESDRRRMVKPVVPPEGPSDPMTRWYGSGVHRMPKFGSGKARQFAKTEKAIYRDFTSSVYGKSADGAQHSAVAQFHQTLIRERLKAKEMQLAKKREKMSHSAEAKERVAKLTDSDPTKRAIAKLEMVAKDFDVQRHGSREMLDAFSGRKMVAKEFRDQLHRSLGINLTLLEAGALMDYMDVSGDGYLECYEFVLFFFRLSFTARSDKRSQHLGELFEREQSKERAKREAERRAKELDKQLYDTTFTEDDLKQAEDMLRECAKTWYFEGYLDQIFLKPFECKLAPTAFRTQLARSFGLELTPAQTAAICKKFDDNGDGDIDGSEFLRGFFRMQQESNAKRALLDEQANFKRETEAKKHGRYTGRDTLGR